MDEREIAAFFRGARDDLRTSFTRPPPRPSIPITKELPMNHALPLVGRTSRDTPVDAPYIVESAQMIELLRRVERLATLSWPVLITGESGTGKEGIARALHLRGPRAPRPFVALDAGALPTHLVEAELFGHERGAFTGAVATRRGMFEVADTGTLFLDEVGELAAATQACLLRALETWEVRRVGASASRRVDVRLVCATNRDLRAMVEAGTFRADLYHRLVPIVLVVPPLRDRPEDVRALTDHLLARIGEDVGRLTITGGARIRLAAHSWPGNVRELRNVLSSAAVAADSGVIEAADIAIAIDRVGSVQRRPTTEVTSFAQVVEVAAGNIAAAAKAVGMPRSTFRDRLLAEARRR